MTKRNNSESVAELPRMDAQILHTLLLSRFPNASLVVRGEAGKFEVDIRCAEFNGKSALERHRAVYSVVKEHIKNGTIHALSITAHTPEENRPQ